MAFLVKIKDDKFQLSAMGLFNVGMDLIPPVSNISFYNLREYFNQEYYVNIEAYRGYRDLHDCPHWKLKMMV